MNTVYITQDIIGRDVSPALDFGSLEPVLPGSAQVVMSATPVLRHIRRKLKDFKPNDYLLLLGDPIIMALCMMVASENTAGQFTVLKWDRRNKNYYPVSLDYYERGETDE